MTKHTEHSLPSRELLKAVRLVEHRAKVLATAVHAGRADWATERYMKFGEAASLLRRQFKGGPLDVR